jgi:hypothetical protein
MQGRRGAVMTKRMLVVLAVVLAVAVGCAVAARTRPARFRSRS